jgi:hypothetical protein
MVQVNSNAIMITNECCSQFLSISSLEIIKVFHLNSKLFNNLSYEQQHFLNNLVLCPQIRKNLIIMDLHQQKIIRFNECQN